MARDRKNKRDARERTTEKVRNVSERRAAGNAERERRQKVDKRQE